jgi:hypothetical protein
VAECALRIGPLPDGKFASRRPCRPARRVLSAPRPILWRDPLAEGFGVLIITVQMIVSKTINLLACGATREGCTLSVGIQCTVASAGHHCTEFVEDNFQNNC